MSEKTLPFDAEFYRRQIEDYREIRPSYQALAQALETVLNEPAQSLDLPTIIQARAKTLTSFAEKIQRPGKHYTDPLNEITDFCGARVIVQTLGCVTSVCQFIEDHFEVFWDDSGNKLELLDADKFGYLSQHYIVAFR